ncbi:hypothetical protein WMY93_031822 [Mugilogobius chulae]|uniref:Secreted protein n=1 Tax=Mugilogobius chulae TaxID=88201 RepID=A0AAW0MF86_9GOBI
MILWKTLECLLVTPVLDQVLGRVLGRVLDQVLDRAEPVRATFTHSSSFHIPSLRLLSCVCCTAGVAPHSGPQTHRRRRHRRRRRTEDADTEDADNNADADTGETDS